jgi:hypothetical protein
VDIGPRLVEDAIETGLVLGVSAVDGIAVGVWAVDGTAVGVAVDTVGNVDSIGSI